MAEQSPASEKGKKLLGLVIRDQRGEFYQIPTEALTQFHMADEEVEAFLKESSKSNQPQPTCFAFSPSDPAASGFVRATPSGFVRVVPSGFVRATPSGFVRVVPSAFVRAVLSGFMRAVPSGFVRATPSSLVRATPFSPTSNVVSAWTRYEQS